MRAPAVRRAAADSVAVTKDAEAAKSLRESLREGIDLEVRKAVLRSLAAIKDAGASDLVASAFKDPALLVEAANAAEQIAGPTLIQMLADLAEAATSPEILVPALGALGRLKAGAPTAAKHAAHADPKVALAAVTALGQIGGDAAAAGPHPRRGRRARRTSARRPIARLAAWRRSPRSGAPQGLLGEVRALRGDRGAGAGARPPRARLYLEGHGRTRTRRSAEQCARRSRRFSAAGASGSSSKMRLALLSTTSSSSCSGSTRSRAVRSG
jgi:hypothetical protein